MLSFKSLVMGFFLLPLGRVQINELVVMEMNDGVLEW